MLIQAFKQAGTMRKARHMHQLAAACLVQGTAEQQLLLAGMLAKP
jgi:hypothetical protein